MNSNEILKTVIDKYELSEPVPQDVHMAMEKSRKENLVRILKKDVRRAVFISAVVSFFLWVKKFGISVSIVKSAAAVSAALIIGTGVITAAGVYTVKKAFEYMSDDTRKIEKTPDVKIKSVGTDRQTLTPVQGILSYTVAVSPVEMDDVSSELLAEYTNIVIQELQIIRGAHAVINIDRLDKYHISDKILTISIIKLNEQSQTAGAKSVYRISARIISTSNSQILMHASVTADDKRGIPDSLRKLAEKIPAKF
jgi:hypothetical protein